MISGNPYHVWGLVAIKSYHVVATDGNSHITIRFLFLLRYSMSLFAMSLFKFSGCGIAWVSNNENSMLEQQTPNLPSIFIFLKS